MTDQEKAIFDRVCHLARKHLDEDQGRRGMGVAAKVEVAFRDALDDWERQEQMKKELSEDFMITPKTTLRPV